MRVSQSFGLGLLLAGVSLADCNCCAPQYSLSTFEYSPHGGAYFQTVDLPGTGDGLNWGLSLGYEQTDVNYCDKICASSYPYEAGFKASDPPENNYINTYIRSFTGVGVSYFKMTSFDFGCTRTGKYKMANGTTVTTEIPTSCKVDVNTGQDTIPDFTYTASYTPKIQVNGYTGLPYAQPTSVYLPGAFNKTINMWFNATASAKKDKTIKVYLDTFNHTNYYCPIFPVFFS